MERSEFADLENPWWLLEDDIGSELDEARTELGASFGWDGKWYENASYLDQLHEALGSELLAELDAADQESTRSAWLSKAIDAVGDSEQASTGSGDDQETPTDPGPSSAQEPAVVSEVQVDASAGVPTGEGVPAAPFDGRSATWDDAWGMLYRLGPTGAYEYAMSDDHATVRAGTTWMSYEEATAARAQPAAPPVNASGSAGVADTADEGSGAGSANEEAAPVATDAAGVAAATDVAASVDEIVTGFLADDETIADVAEQLGMEPDELKALLNNLPEGFDQMVAEALSK